jgi:hypothetical protein
MMFARPEERSRARGSLRERRFELACWYLAVLVPTLVFKLKLLNAIYVGGLSAALSSADVDLASSHGWLEGLVFFARDPLEVFLAVGAVFALGRALFPRTARILFAAGVFLVVLVLGAVQFYYAQVANLPTLETLREGIRWAEGHPAVVGKFVTPHRLLLLPVTRAGGRIPFPRVARKAVETAAAGCLLVGLATWAVAGSSPSDPRLGGYWSNLALTFVGRDERSPLQRREVSPAEIVRTLGDVVYPVGRPADPDYQVPLPVGRRPRHILIVELETAARKFYPLATSDALPTLRRMSQQAIVSDRHYSTAPVTISAVYSLLSGTYPRGGSLPDRYGDFLSDGLATVLSARGYETTYIDSYVFDWSERGDDRIVRSLGFSRLLESGTEPAEGAGAYERAVEHEQRSFDRALESILDASRRGRHAFVFVATILGHYPWAAGPQGEGLPASARMLRIAQVIDGMLAHLLDGLDAHGLGDDVLIVVTGDHGLRFKSEFDSAGESFPQTELTYNVPFLLYAPGLFSQPVRLDHQTSHVDLVPTLLDLCGIPRESLLLHGQDMLDRGLARRVIFLTGGGLYPVDSLRWLGRDYSVNHLSGGVSLQPGGPPPADSPTPVFSQGRARRIVGEAEGLFDATAAVFLRRALSERRAAIHVGTAG